MNRKQLILLIVLAAALGGLGWLAYQKQQSSFATSKVRLGEKLLPDFPVNDVAQFTIKQPKAELTLAKKDEVWTVVERGNYPANFQTIKDLLLKFGELKVTKPVVRPRLAALELQTPDKGNGTLIEFKDASGKLIKTVLLGIKHQREGGGGESPFGGPGGGGFPDGRYVMVGSDVASASLVNEPFSNADAKPADWLQKEGWFKVEKIKSISVASGVATNDWKLSRESETGEWKLADTKSGETLDNGKSGGATSALSYPNFEDVVTGTNAAGAMDKPIVGTVETFEGYTYTVKIGKKSEDEKYNFQVDVAGNFPKERTPGKDEKPEDKDKLDKEFKEALTKKEEKLKAEKEFSKWVYVVSKWTIDPFLKGRHELLTEKTAEAKPDAAKPAAGLPGGLPGTLPGTIPGLPKE